VQQLEAIGVTFSYSECFGWYTPGTESQADGHCMSKIFH